MNSRAIHRIHFGLALAASIAAGEWSLAASADDHALRRFDGVTATDQLGQSVSFASDLDGDQVPDVLVGLRSTDSSLAGNHVSARAFSGRTGALLFEVAAPNQSHPSSNSVMGLPDLNGDLRSEVAVGTPGTQVGINPRQGLVRILDSSGSLLRFVTGPSANSLFGASIASAGDTNNDGFPDFIVGSPGNNTAYVFSGNLAAPVLLVAVVNAAGFKGRLFGSSVGMVGNIDGVAGTEVVVGAPFGSGDNGENTGAVYVFNVFQSQAPIFARFGDGTDDQLGTDVDGGTDLNGDAMPDFLGSAIGTLVDGSSFTTPGTGFVRIYSGRDGQTIRTIASPQVGDLFGFSASLSAPCGGGTGPVLLVGAPDSLHPTLNAITGRVDVFRIDTGALITRIQGVSALDGLGIGVSRFGDLDGDGSGDFLAGAHGRGQGALFSAGSAYILSCTPIPRPDISADPSPLSFASKAVGTSSNLSVTVHNQGTGDLTVSPLSLAGGSSAAFSLPSPAGFTVPPLGSRAVVVQYNPATAAIHGGTLQIPSSDPDTPLLLVPLFGEGVRPGIQVTPAALAFGAVDIDDYSWATVKVKSVGNQALTVNGVSLSGGGAGDYSLLSLPSFPRTLYEGQHFNFLVLLTPSQGGSRTASVQVASSDPLAAQVTVPLTATGVPPNLPPIADIQMDVPYTNSEQTIHFHGEGSTDPDGSIVAYHWDFGHDGQTAVSASPIHTFPGTPGQLRMFEVRLTVTDNGGKQDPTSVTVINHIRSLAGGGGRLRSRFWGAIQQGGQYVHEGMTVEAWVGDDLVAQTSAQLHLGSSVFAIEVPQDDALSGFGGADGVIVTFKYGHVTANETGTWWRATDQELNLTAPRYIPHTFESWCFRPDPRVDICGDPGIVPLGGLVVEFARLLIPIPFPHPDPGPLRFVQAFQLEFADAATGQQLIQLAANYEIHTSYSDAEVRAAGVDERTLRLYSSDAAGSRWTLAGNDVLDTALNSLVTTLDHATLFALLGSPGTSGGLQMPSDCNQDGVLDLSDGVCLLSFLFLGTVPRLPCGDGTASAPSNLALLNSSPDSSLDISDAVSIFSYLFLGGPPHPLGTRCLPIEDCPERAECRG